MRSKGQLFGLDSSCVIAMLCDWHVQHRTTFAWYERMLASGALPVIPAQVILECHSVLTRLPAPHRIPAEIAVLLLERAFSETAVINGLQTPDLWRMLRALATKSRGGGKVYDAAIAYAAAEAGALILFTWNIRDFTAVAPASLAIREPSVSRGQ